MRFFLGNKIVIDDDHLSHEGRRTETLVPFRTNVYLNWRTQNHQLDQRRKAESKYLGCLGESEKRICRSSTKKTKTTTTTSNTENTRFSPRRPPRPRFHFRTVATTTTTTTTITMISLVIVDRRRRRRTKPITEKCGIEVCARTKSTGNGSGKPSCVVLRSRPSLTKWTFARDLGSIAAALSPNGRPADGKSYSSCVAFLCVIRAI